MERDREDGVRSLLTRSGTSRRDPSLAVSRRDVSSSGSVRSGTIATRHPASYADLTPFGASSTARQSAVLSPIEAHALMYTSGAGFPRFTDPAPTMTSGRSSSPAMASIPRALASSDDVATAVVTPMPRSSSRASLAPLLGLIPSSATLAEKSLLASERTS